MSNRKHLAILCKGPEAWAEWRRDNPSIRPDLRFVDFNNRDKLPKIDFTGVDLSTAMLAGIHYKEGAFHKTNLRKADFREANVVDTWFVEADLRDALLTDATLVMSNFTRCDARGANVVSHKFVE